MTPYNPKLLPVALVLILAAALQAIPAAGQDTIIPPDRRIQWDPGIPGGIPEVTGPVESILDHAADPSGIADSKSAIQSAISALPAGGGVVFFPEGKYRISSKISIGKDGIVFRGEGRKSKLFSEANGECLEVITYERGSWQTLPGGASKGDMTVTVEDGSRFTPGEFAEIDQVNDSALMYTDPDWIVDWAENAVGQLFEVESVSGNQVTFKTPVNHNFTDSLNARIRPQGFVRNVGFEDFYIEKMVANNHTIMFKNTAYCWVKGVESYHTRRTHVTHNTSLGQTIRDSYFHASFDYGGGGSGYGVECGYHTTNCLVENNIFDSLRHAMIIQVGANGNVYGYNYSINPVQGEGETNLNQGWDPPDISIHGHYPYMNLFEGNELEEMGIGDFWGPAGPGNTYFRNRVNGEGIVYHDASHTQNVVGNITTDLKDPEGLSEEKLEHGNQVNGILSWDPGIPSHDLPASYYLDSMPAFFDQHSWPPFGPDAEPGNKLPAQTRFEDRPILTVTLDNSSVEKYQKLELTIDNGKSYTNPFDPDEVDISALFTSPSLEPMRINAFWDGADWKIRFAGNEKGIWKYKVSVVDEDGTEELSGNFRVNKSDRKGWIGPSATDPHYLVHDNGTPFFGVGMAVPWLVYDNRYYPQPGLLEHLEGYGVNFINWLFTSWDILLLRESFDRYSMADATAFDQLMEDAEQHGIKLLLGIWIHDLLRDDPHPWSGFYDWESNPFNQLTDATGFFGDSASWAYQEKYYRYIIARWGYSSSVGMWHTVAEINGTNAIYDTLAMTKEEEGWHYRINKFFQDNDPFRHPTTVSGSGGYEFGDGWDLTGSPQVHEYPWPEDQIAGNAERIAAWTDQLTHTYEKPCLVGEFGKSVYEEGKSESFLHNGIWAGLMSGACTTPLHWWGGQIALQPENFSTFNPVMMEQLTYLQQFAEATHLAACNFASLYSAPDSLQPMLTGVPEGRAYGLRGDSLHLCWVYQIGETSNEDFSGVTVTYPELPAGRYAVSFYDTWNGEWINEPDTIDTQPVGTDTTGREPEPLSFTCPDFTGDVAMKIEYTGPKIPDGPDGLIRYRNTSLKVYPNPAQGSVTIENREPLQSVSLMDASGRLLSQLFPEGRTRCTIDLAGHPSGIYLLEIWDEHGYPEIRKVVVR